jgi:hypothetical protein
MQTYRYADESKAWASKFLVSQADSLVVATRPAESYGCGFVIGEFNLHNRSGAACMAGIGGRLPINLWTMGQWTDANYVAGTVYTDDTVDAQSAATGDVTLDTVAANNDGFVIGCDVPFNIASIMISQASASNTVWKIYYSIATLGTGFSNNYTEITNSFVVPNFATTGEQLLWFEQPVNWVKPTPATTIINRHGLTVPSKYLIVVKSTTAPDTTRGTASLAVLGRMMMSTEGLADNDILQNIGGKEIYLPPQCDAICAALSTANIQNRIDLKYRYAG